MKARLMGIVSALAIAAGASVVAASPGYAATPAVQITRVYYNSPGTDNRSNTSLNAEYVILKNTRTTAINLRGWTLRDKANHVYTFASFSLGAKKTVVVHTGRGTNTAAHRYWGQGNYVWNNTGDTAYVRTPARTLVDSCSWRSTGSSTTC